jgi:hypothetical protein
MARKDQHPGGVPEPNELKEIMGNDGIEYDEKYACQATGHLHPCGVCRLIQLAGVHDFIFGSRQQFF